MIAEIDPALIARFEAAAQDCPFRARSTGLLTGRKKLGMVEVPHRLDLSNNPRRGARPNRGKVDQRPKRSPRDAWTGGTASEHSARGRLLSGENCRDVSGGGPSGTRGGERGFGHNQLPVMDQDKADVYQGIFIFRRPALTWGAGYALMS